MVASREQLEALLVGRGRDLLARLAEGGDGDAEPLRLGEALRRDYPAELVAAALTLRDVRARARTKFDRADDMFFTRAGLEQASGERVARHRAERFRGAAMVADLCTGIGGDLIALAEEGPTMAVDRDPLHLRMAELNAAVYGVGGAVRPWLGDVRDVALDGVGAVFVDPARRDERGRGGPGRSEPPLAWCFGLAERVAAVGVKAAPGLDVGQVPRGWEVEFVAEGRELKEAALWSPALATTARRATILPRTATLVETPGEGVPVVAPGGYLFDPNPAVTRAGLVEDLARRIGAWKIDEQIAFLSGDRPVATPFARTLRIVESMPWHLKRIAARLREMGVGAVDIRRRGLAGDVEETRRRLQLAGSRRATLVMTRVEDRPWCLVCQEIAG